MNNPAYHWPSDRTVTIKEEMLLSRDSQQASPNPRKLLLFLFWMKKVPGKEGENTLHFPLKKDVRIQCTLSSIRMEDEFNIVIRITEFFLLSWEKLLKEVEEYNSPVSVQERERIAELESERLAEQQRMDLKNEQTRTTRETKGKAACH